MFDELFDSKFKKKKKKKKGLEIKSIINDNNKWWITCLCFDFLCSIIGDKHSCNNLFLNIKIPSLKKNNIPININVGCLL